MTRSPVFNWLHFPEESPIRFVTRLLVAAYFIEAGLLLTIAPWTALWDRNYFAALWPWLRAWMSIGLVRGAVSAAGVITAIGGLSDLYALFARSTARFEPPAEPPGL